MFCPKCLSNSLHLKEKGVIHILVNGRQKDTGRFLFSLESRPEITQNISNKILEHFKWIASFQNTKPVENVNIITSDAKCDNGCALPLAQKFSLLDYIVSTREVKSMVLVHAKECGLDVELDI
ncbi:hypothetical protein M902_2242 [Bacteriovorax sp. BAL6_X]|uniref:hypothetical protein n=1 Tax=Bacteriovorax sp. BAL6_X TaxID=1201290 RepID=UPI000386A231|nr:hypothetical protein [Bacteriovorax sp. BAL6_X]EPZ51685.1 hypothetical protein M902_2242 [Bacteriovorax sp. BAL6_X]